MKTIRIHCDICAQCATPMALEYFCRCLNVHLRVPAGVVQETQNESLTELAKSESFFRDAFTVLAPRRFTVDKKLRCLCRNREVDNWTIILCVNCKMDTYATMNGNSDSTIVAVSPLMEKDPSAAALLFNLDNYSPIYKLLVSLPTTSNQSERTETSVTRELVHNQMEELKVQTVQLLNAENERLLERIRNFENEQMSHFNELQSRVRKEQGILAQVLMSYHQENVGGSYQLAPPAASNIMLTPPDRLVTQSSSTPDKTSKSRSVPPSTSKPSDDIMFAMDEEDEGSNLQDEIQTEAEELEENDNYVPDGYEQSDDSDDAFATVAADVRLYATSLPISMHRGWQPSLQSHVVVNANEADVLPGTEHAKMDDPQWIAASIQALAMSVRGNDGTEMFGARPRPRLNTLD